MKRLLFPICAFAVALVGAGSASATPILTPGLSVASGGITFTNFTCAFTGSGMSQGSCSSIDVAALTPSPAGIQFSTNLAVLGNSSADASLTFSLASLTGINDIGLDFNSNFFGREINSVTEDVYSALGGNLVGTATVMCGTLTGCAATTSDNIALSGTYSNLYITKDINLSGYTNRSSGTVSIVQQTFDAATPTPEPFSLGMIGGGLAILGLVRIRRNKKA
jgi:hypothetical protein